MPEELENTGGESGIDMDAAAAEIEEGLGLTEEVESDTPADDEPSAPAAADKAPAASATPDPAKSAPAGAPDDKTARAPDTWRPDAVRAWESLPPEARAEIWKREEDIRTGLAAARDHTEVASGVEKLLAPYAQILNDYKVNPWDHIASLLNAHATLMFGKPEQKAAILEGLIKQTGLDRAKLAAGETAPYNAENQALRSELQQLRQHVYGLTNQVSEARLTELEEQISEFASRPENQYFWQVAPETQRLLAQNPQMTLAAAYADAVMLNPLTRAKEIDRLTRERAEKQSTEAAARAKAARKASAVNVRSREGGRPAPTSDNWEDTLKDALAEIRARN